MARIGGNIYRQVIVGIEADGGRGFAPITQQLVSLLKPFAAVMVNSFPLPMHGGPRVKGVAVLELQQGSVSDLLAQPKPDYVKYWERNGQMAMCGWDDPLFVRDQWGLKRIGALEDWTTQVDTKVAIAIIDSGIMWQWDPTGNGRVVGVHEDLDERAAGPQFPSRFWRSGEYPPIDAKDEDYSGVADDFNGARLIEDDRDGAIGDENGHGTMLAGIMFATANNGRGLASPLTRYWPNIRMMPVKFFDADSRPTPPNAVAAIDYAVRNGARVINASWHVGPGNKGLGVVREAILRAQQHNVLVVAAAGNDGSENDRYPTYPANLSLEFDNVLTVHATDRRDHKASFSNYGRKSVHLGAPGVRIMTTGRYIARKPIYRAMSGTSASTAFATLAAALVIAAEEHRSGRRLKPKHVIKHLLRTADIIPELRACSTSGARLNMHRAVHTRVKRQGNA